MAPRAYMYSFGEEGMQLVQPSKVFSVTIFRMRSIACARANLDYMLLFWELHALFSEGVVAQKLVLEILVSKLLSKMNKYIEIMHLTLRLHK